MKAEASVFASIVSRLLDEQHCPPGDALVTAYRMYAERCWIRPELSFDRAFALVSDLRGIWMRSEQRLAMHRCTQCHARYVGEVGAPSPGETGCVFCQLLSRYLFDGRLQDRFAGRRVGRRARRRKAGANTEKGP